MTNTSSNYALAREIYAEIGVDTDAALKALDQVSVSLHCWQGDDVGGFENAGAALSGGIMATGTYPGKARTAPELRADLEQAISLIPGALNVNLHAFYLENGGKHIDRDQIEPAHFAAWAAWARKNNLGLDFNPTYFSHPLSADGLTLSHPDDGVRRFWIEHGKRSRKISEYLGRETGKRSLNNLWIPDGFKERPIDSLAPRKRLLDALNEIYAEKLDPACMRDAVESKLFGIGCESYTVGSHEFYLGYAATHRDILLTLDCGHFHPTEVVSAKLSSCLLYCDELLLHVSRPVRWDSDHVVTFDDELQALMQEIVRAGAMDRVNIALDYFDGSINRIAAWVIGTRNTKKALLKAMLEPVEKLKSLENEGDFTSRLALTEEYKSYPAGAVWDAYCEMNGVPVRESWLSVVKEYEKKVVSER